MPWTWINVRQVRHAKPAMEEVGSENPKKTQSAMTTAVQVNNLLEDNLRDLKLSCAEGTRLAVTMPHPLRRSTVTAEYY